MTQEQKRIKIAEACGWIDVEMCPVSGRLSGYVDGDYHGVPDYFSDLNACHEMEKVLTEEQCYTYHALLKCDEPPTSEHEVNMWVFHTAAAQRAEAFGLTLGLWKEGE